jgi:hypothetical protein
VDGVAVGASVGVAGAAGVVGFGSSGSGAVASASSSSSCWPRPFFFEPFLGRTSSSS